MSIFSKFKDSLLEIADSAKNKILKFPMAKTGIILNNYTRGDFIVVGGRKTSGKSSFILSNYVISPLLQRLNAGSSNPFELKVIYINTRKNPKATMERMVVNYISTKSKGNKIGVPTLYGYDGPHVKMSKEGARKALASTMDALDAFVNKGYLNVVIGKKTVFEIEELIMKSMEEYGTYDSETKVFKYQDKYKDMMPIIAIDDITSISGEKGGGSIRNDNAHQLAIRLKQLAKTLDVIIVLAVPSFTASLRNAAVHKSTLDELAPYSTYADRTIILHNPIETEDKTTIDYRTAEFVNPATGVCYLRTAYIASNYMGVSGVTLGYFIYPENGFMQELPRADSDYVEAYTNIAQAKKVKKESTDAIDNDI